MSEATRERPSTEPGATRQGDGHPQPAPSAEAPPTWTITTTTGYTAAGYLPPWAEDDPSAADVPPQHFATELADLTHSQPFSGLRMAVSVTDASGTDTVILSGSINCAPYSEDPAARLPVVNLQLVDDYWLHNLDPDQLATIATQLRTQADHLDHEVRPALIAAREDWLTRHGA